MTPPWTSAVVVPFVLTTAQAQTITPSAALIRLFSSAEVKAEWFSSDFLKAVPIEALNASIQQMKEEFGAVQKVTEEQGKPLVLFEKGRVVVNQLALDAQGRFSALIVAPQSDDAEAKIALLKRVFVPGPLDFKLFSTEFRAQVPDQQLTALFDGLAQQYGPLKQVEPLGPDFKLSFEKGVLMAKGLKLNARGEIVSLLLNPEVKAAQFTNFTEAEAAFRALPGQVSVYVAEVGKAPALALNADQPLAVASSAKLAILGELQAQVDAGQRQWTDEVALTEPDKSLPSGYLQNEPAGRKYSLRDLADRMIRDSDNTATDLLLRVVGREGVERRFGQQPFFSTRELFVLRMPENLNLWQSFQAGDLTTKRHILTKSSTLPLPTVEALVAVKTVPQGLEWYTTTSKLCQLMAEVAPNPSTQLNPGVTQPGMFQKVSYKGGSDAGIFQLTTQVMNKVGKTLCLSATWNDPQANLETLVGLYQGLLALVK